MFDRPVDFAVDKLTDTMRDALGIVKNDKFFLWNDCICDLIQRFAQHYESLINRGNSPEEARDDTLKRMLHFRDAVLKPVLQRQFDADITPYDTDEPPREHWHKLNIKKDNDWHIITYAELQLLIDIMVERLRDDLIYEPEGHRQAQTKTVDFVAQELGLMDPNTDDT